MQRLNTFVTAACVALLISLGIQAPAVSQQVARLYGTASGNPIPLIASSGGFLNVAIQGGVPPSFDAGLGTSDLKSCGIIHTDTTSVTSTATASTQTLWTYSLPANTLGTNGDSLLVEVFGSKTANGNTITTLLNFGAGGSKLVATSTAWTANSATSLWRIRARFVRISATGTEAHSLISYGAGDGSVVVMRELRGAAANLTDNLANAVTIAMQTTQVSASADTTFRGAHVTYCPIAPQ